MKKILIVMTLACMIFSCQRDEEIVGYEEIELEPFIIENYFEDAKLLYMDEILKDVNHANYNNPILDSLEVIKILKIIQAVYNCDSDKSDRVFNDNVIHARYCYGLNNLFLLADTSLTEIKNLSNNVIPTGELALDKILNDYNFDSVKTAYGFPNSNWMYLYTKDEYNMIPVEKELQSLGSIEIAEFDRLCIGDGNTITLIRDENSAMITFSVGDGDCPAGCISHKYWEFEVKNGKAKFKRTYRD